MAEATSSNSTNSGREPTATKPEATADTRRGKLLPQAAAGIAAPASSAETDTVAAPAYPGGDRSQAGTTAGQTSEVSQRRFEFLFAPNVGASLAPLAASSIGRTLESLEGVKVLDRISPPRISVFGSDDHPVAGDVVVAEMSWERALALQATAGNHVIMERNWELQHLGFLAPAFAGVGTVSASVAPPTTEVQIQVLGQGRPLARALVVLSAQGFPAQGETDADGKVTLPIYGSITTGIQSVYVKPFADFWETFIEHPSLAADAVNTIALEPLSAFAGSHFPGNPYLGWGQRLMGLEEDTLRKYTGRGVRIAIIDSGCDNQHPVLTHIGTGLDYTNVDGTGAPNPHTWTTDKLSHGTHCSGVIAGNGRNGIRGFAPEAEVHILKLFPDGRMDDLIRALKYCIENKIDVANCSLGSSEVSASVQVWMERARQAGVAVVVAAGNSAGPVQFPALLQSVLSVAAIGKEGNFPTYTYHRQTEPGSLPGLMGADGIFAPRFTCFGPQIKVCGPGVAVISSVPGGGYAAWDGTSMAAPHVTGLLALIAAHHPTIANMPRGAERVDRMLQIAIGSSVSVGLDAMHGGAGIPSVAGALQPKMQSWATPSFTAGSGLTPPAAADIELVVKAVLGQVLGAGWRSSLNGSFVT
ncbi:peptidase S8 and S53 subtilisin kexin sedolisin [Bradyrhizobium sp.]|uniref:S8 family serine peptidase n=1 Tax=Bradyrhizobium sp. TaxID=376 RepID=UPI0007C17473|nr:S8 family serine peptidase [Bradyrhizobium sp.]CUT10083.1 peptidase S8 and S53 subtilisin kexin sedolisin [Bradyrhizobium sp.]